MFGMGPMELMIIGVIAVLLFGSKLPEVAKSLGSSYREFKKGLNEFQSATQHDDSSYSSNSSSSSSKSYDYDEYDDSATAPRFEPPPEEESAGSDEASASSESPAETQSDDGADSQEPQTS
jgi:sec-independent protein translocase protein TatA